MITIRCQLAANYTQIGTGLIDVEVLGGEGLTALKEVMASVASESETVESSDYQETDIKATVQVGMVLTSVKKDLKIKFTNKSTGKLIANIPFEVEITSPEGKTSTWIDRDMDGIIYEKDISSGKYTVSLVPLKDEKYNKYLMLAANEKVDVKENIAYEKVDVSAEIKDESEIETLRKAIAVTDLGLRRILSTLEPGQMEYQAQAEFEYAIKAAGAQSPSFATIAGSGINGCMLHYGTNHCEMKDGSLLLMDLGAKYKGYCADITRTALSPAKGRCS